MILILKNILGILTDPKNTRMFLLGGIVVLLFLLVRQCDETEYAKGEVTRFQNNLVAANLPSCLNLIFLLTTLLILSRTANTLPP